MGRKPSSPGPASESQAVVETPRIDALPSTATEVSVAGALAIRPGEASGTSSASQNPMKDGAAANPGDRRRSRKPGTGKARGWQAADDWRERLAPRTPEGILARIVDGDPLGLRRLVGEVIRDQRRIADADRVHLRAVACIAHRATSGDGPESPRWIEERVLEALDGVVDSERARADAMEAPGAREALTVLAEPLGLDPKELRRACAALNAQPAAERDAFFTLVIEGEDLESAASARGTTAREMGLLARRALTAVFRLGKASEERDNGAIDAGSERDRSIANPIRGEVIS